MLLQRMSQIDFLKASLQKVSSGRMKTRYFNSSWDKPSGRKRAAGLSF